MSDGKGIERYYADFDSDAAAPDGQRIEMVSDPDGSWVDFDDHLDALGAATKTGELRGQRAEEEWWGPTTDYWYERAQEWQRMVESAGKLKQAAYERENAALDRAEQAEKRLEELRKAVELLLVARRPLGPDPAKPRGFYLPDNPESRLFLDRLAALLDLGEESS